MHAAAFSPRGGVAPKTTSLRGQGLIEYVLIAAVIGLVVIFAGPQVSGAIRNQFNQVSTTLDSGTDGTGGVGGGNTGEGGGIGPWRPGVEQDSSGTEGTGSDEVGIGPWRPGTPQVGQWRPEHPQ